MIDDGLIRGSPPRRADLEDLVSLFANPRVGRTLGGVQSREATLATLDRWQGLWSAGGPGPLVFRFRGTNRLLGYAGLAPVDSVEERAHELLYGLHPECWGQGLATRMAKLVLAELRSHGAVREIIGFTLVSNRASQRVLEKAGLSYERELLHAGRPHRLYRLPRSATPGSGAV